MAYKVRFVNYLEYYCRMESEIDAAFKEIMRGGDFILREHVRRFENNIASFWEPGTPSG